MSNPLFKKCNPLSNTNPKRPSLDELTKALKAQDDTFFQKMAEIARARGISESAIQEGMTYVNTLRH